MAVMNYKQTNRYPDGTGMLLDTTPGTPDSGSYTTEAQLKQWTNAEIISGSQVVGKAQKDQNGNVIDTTYATKAEVNALSARVSNLEQTTKQDEQTVQYPDDGNYSSLMPNKVPLSVADYAEVPRFRGKTRAWNQLAKQISTQTNNGITCTNNGDGTYTLNGTLEAGQTRAVFVVAEWNTDISALHKYLITDDAPSGASYGFCGGSLYYRNCIYDTVNLGGFNALIIVEANVSNVKITPILRDVTTILSDWSPTDITTANIPLMVQQIPDLLKCDAYDAGSIVSTQYSGVKSVGVNIWDEEWEVGAYYTSDGSKKDGLNDCIRCKNLIPIIPNTWYYKKCSEDYGPYWNLFYDSNKNYLGYSGSNYNAAFLTPDNAYFMAIYTEGGYGTTYNHDIQICLNSYADKTTYHPYQRNTIMLSQPVELKSAGAVSEVLNMQTGKKTRPIATIDMKDMEYSPTAGIFVTRLPNSKQSADCGITTPGLIIAPWKSIAQMVDGDFVWSAYEDYYYIKDTSCTTAEEMRTKYNGWLINYELATPDDPTQLTPVIDNTILTEGGGTIETIQTQTPVIDNCLDVTYDFIPA